MNPIISLLTQALAYPLYWHREELNAGWNLLAAILSSIVTDESGYTITAKWRVCYAVWEGSSPMIVRLLAMRDGVGWRETGVQARKLQLHRPLMHLVMLDLPHVMRGIATMEVCVRSQLLLQHCKNAHCIVSNICTMKSQMARSKKMKKVPY